jgi:hypothetical protein
MVAVLAPITGHIGCRLTDHLRMALAREFNTSALHQTAALPVECHVIVSLAVGFEVPGFEMAPVLK